MVSKLEGCFTGHFHSHFAMRRTSPKEDSVVCPRAAQLVHAQGQVLKDAFFVPCKKHPSHFIRASVTIFVTLLHLFMCAWVSPVTLEGSGQRARSQPGTLILPALPASRVP